MWQSGCMGKELLRQRDLEVLQLQQESGRKEEEHKRALEAMQQSLREKDAENKRLRSTICYLGTAAQLNDECDSDQE